MIVTVDAAADADPPEVLPAASDPVNGEAHVFATSDIDVAFTEPIVFGASGTVSLYDEISATVIETIDISTAQATGDSQVSIDGSTLTINPTDPLPGPTVVSVDIGAGAVEDSAGNGVAAFDGTDTLEFSTLDPSALRTAAVGFDTADGAGIEDGDTTGGGDDTLVITDPAHLTSTATIVGGGGFDSIVLPGEGGRTYDLAALVTPIDGFETVATAGSGTSTVIVDADSGLDDFTDVRGRDFARDVLVSRAAVTDLSTAIALTDWDAIEVSADDATLIIDAGVLASAEDFVATGTGTETLTGNLGADVDLTGRDLSGFEVIETTATGDTTLRLDGATAIGDVTELATGDTAGSDTIETPAATLDLSGVTLTRFDRLVTTNPDGSTLVAGPGEQAVVGAGGDDVLAGGGGGDTLTGNDGLDDFSGTPDALDGDRITDFTADDRIVVTGAATAAEDGAFLQFDASGDQPLTLDTDTPAADTFDAADTTIELPGVPDVGFQISTAGGDAFITLNTAPEADHDDTPLTTDENTNHVFAAGDFGFTDPDAGDSLQRVRITALPASGTLFLDANGNDTVDPGEAVEADDLIDRSAIDAGDLQYMPPRDIDGSLTANVAVEVGDGQAFSTETTVVIEAVGVDDPPVVAAPPDLAIDATGLYTPIDLERDGSAAAVDEEQPTVVARPAGGEFQPRLRPGTHTIEWSATDDAGQSHTDPQTVEVRPRVGLGPDRTVQEGETVELAVELNGDPIAGTTPAIDFDVATTSTAGSADYAGLGAPGTIAIDTGRSASIDFDALAGDASGEGPETLVIEFTGASDAVLADRRRATITIVEDNVAPRVSLSAAQGSNDPAVVIDGTAGADPVTVTAATEDATAAADMDFAWNGAAIGLTDLDADADPATFEFDPTTIAPGVYPIEVTATDDGIPARSASALLRLRVTDSFPALGDDDTDGDGAADDAAGEGISDRDGDGLPDYRDPHRDASTLQQSLADGRGFRLETQAGLNLRLGPLAFARDLAGARLTGNDIAAVRGTRDERDNVGGYFGFEISGLPEPGAAADVVIPQRAPVPPRAVYRKLGATGGWFDFVETGGAALASAPGAEGFCPPPDDPAYTAGLTEGDWCVRLTLIDGGPNDGDGSANARILDPGGVAGAPPPDDETTDATSNGGGALSGWLLLLAGGLAWARTRRATAG